MSWNVLESIEELSKQQIWGNAYLHCIENRTLYLDQSEL
jgi:hypothetical protein